MRLVLSALLVSSFAPLLVRADVTIRYKTETSSPMTPAANRTVWPVIHMKGSKGVTISDREKIIVDFARQEVTIADTVRKKFATVPASEYGAKMAAQMTAMMPQTEGMADMLKGMKTACDSKNVGGTEMIQGVRAEERDVTCSMTMQMPDGLKETVPAMGMKIVMRSWVASPAERVRVPGLWQLSGFELWQKYFMNPMNAAGKIAPEGMAPLVGALQKDQSAMLRFSTEMSMSMPFAGGDGSPTVFMKMNQEVVELSTALLDDSIFTVPAEYSAEPFTDVINGIEQALLQSVKADLADAVPAASKTPIPENIKAFVPALAPVTQTKPVAPVDAGGNRIQGMVELLVTVGSKGNVEQTEVIVGREELRKAASDAVRQWTFRPVIRNGAPVVAYTDTEVDFNDYSKGPPAGGFQFTPELAAAGERMAQLEEAFPRSPEQEFADLEQEAGGADKSRRYDHLNELAVKAVQVGANDKAKAYATELLATAPQDVGGWNYGNAIHDGHMVLGLLALRNDDVATARQQLLEAGKTPGSPQLNSFGPNMVLASELLKRGERDAVLEYFGLCRTFWKMGGQRLDAWSETVRNGGTPAFAGSLR